jgi:hypothetical protein
MVTVKRLLPLALGICLLNTSCQNSGSTENDAADSAMQRVAIELADVPASPEYPGAQLAINNVKAEKQGTDSTKVSFMFDVNNYELKSQTADAEGKSCNNSDKGQHIHFILDNKPYVALYEPKHEVVLANGTEHYLLCFLSRSYHESVKSPGAAVLYHFKVDEAGKLQKLDTPTAPMVFYSRPKGDYLGKDTENLLFDFYVWNGTLSNDGYKVKAHISGDGVDTSIMITDWKAHFLKNMPMGKPNITLTLVDKDGIKVDGPGSEVTREFHLSKDEPMVTK